jgi:ribonucleoside-triphosphate reductase
MANVNQPGLQDVPQPVSEETTDSALFVRTSADWMVDFSRERIVDALVRETLLDRETAELIGREVEEEIRAFRTRTLTAPLIRELVDAKLLEHGLEGARRIHTRLSMPLYDVSSCCCARTRRMRTSPRSRGDESTLAGKHQEGICAAASSRRRSPTPTCAATCTSTLGFVDRPYCSGQSLEYVRSSA